MEPGYDRVGTIQDICRIRDQRRCNKTEQFNFLMAKIEGNEQKLGFRPELNQKGKKKWNQDMTGQEQYRTGHRIKDKRRQNKTEQVNFLLVKIKENKQKNSDLDQHQIGKERRNGTRT